MIVRDEYKNKKSFLIFKTPNFCIDPEKSNMPIVSPEEVEILAYRLYKQKEPYEKMIWRLAELCLTIQMNIEDNYEKKSCNIDAFETVDDFVEHLKFKSIISPKEDIIRPYADKLFSYQPEKSKLHWYIAEKTLVFERLKDRVDDHF
jgi:hypothetical protein